MCAVDCFKCTRKSSFGLVRSANLHELNSNTSGLCWRLSLVIWAWWIMNRSPALSVTTSVNTVGYPDTSKQVTQLKLTIQLKQR